MAVVERELTEQESVAVSTYVRQGCSGTEALRVAGYSQPAGQVNRVFSRPAVQRAIYIETQRYLQELAPLALNTLKRALTDDSAPWSVKATAAKEVLDRAGHTSKINEKQGDNNRKPLEDMSPDELEDFIRKGQAIVEAEKRKGPGIVDITPNNAQSTDADDI